MISRRSECRPRQLFTAKARLIGSFWFPRFAKELRGQNENHYRLGIALTIITTLIVVFAIESMDLYNPVARFVDAQNQNQGICDRTVEIQLGILDWLGNGQGLADCASITDADLAGLTTLRRVGKPALTSLKSGDLAGITGLMTLDLQRNEISELPADNFDGLDALTDLRFGRNNIEDLPAGIFSGLPNLATLAADGNRLTSIDADWFNGLEGGGSLTRFEFTGNDISAVDASNNSVSSYGLSDAVEACILLPDELRSNISSLALVVINTDDSLTILSSIVRISSSGTNVCGSLSSVPAKLAVGTAGSPAALPTAVLETADTSDLPDTGGAPPLSPMVVFWILIVGLASIVVGGAMRRSRRNSIN